MKTDCQDQILRLPDVEQLVGLSRTTIYRLVQTAQFPAPIKLGLRAVGWRQTDITNWVASRPAVRVAAA